MIRCGNVTSAGRQLNVNQTTVSRQIAELETQLGKPLFDRQPTGWVLTSAGESIVALTEEISDLCFDISRKVEANSTDLRGLIRVTAVDICVEEMILPTIKDFKQLYPEIDIELITSSDPLDLASRDADIALRATKEPPANLVGKKIGKLAYHIYGSKEFMDLKKPDCITWVGDRFTLPDWIKKNYPEVKKPLRTNSALAMVQMTKLGMGVAQLPCALADNIPQITRMPVNFVEPGTDFWVLSHIDLRGTARIRLYRDHLVKYLMSRIDDIEGNLSGPNRVRQKDRGVG